jgi:hypothetical protein
MPGSAIGGVEGRRAGAESFASAASESDRDFQQDLHRAQDHVSALDRLVADAGPLGKFRTDQPDALPSGTSSFTVPVSQTIAHVEARMASPNERALGAPRTAELREVQQIAMQDAARLRQPLDTQRAQLVTPRPDVATDTDNRAAAFTRGSLPARDA